MVCLIPSCSSRFICTQMWDQPPPCWARQLPPCHKSSPPGCPSPPLLPVWTNLSSLSLWLLDSHIVRFCQFRLFFVFKLLFFWLCEEAQCVYLRLHLGWKSTVAINILKAVSSIDIFPTLILEDTIFSLSHIISCPYCSVVPTVHDMVSNKPTTLVMLLYYLKTNSQN